MSGPHALCCITCELTALLDVEESLKVTLNNDNCWAAEELNEFGYCAANIRVSSSRTDGNKKVRRLNDGSEVCTYDYVMPIDIEIYALRCEDSFCKAASVSAKIMGKLLLETHKVPVRRIRPIGDSYTTTNRGDIEFTLNVAQVELDYIFAPAQPWLLWKGIS